MVDQPIEEAPEPDTFGDRVIARRRALLSDGPISRPRAPRSAGPVVDGPEAPLSLSTPGSRSNASPDASLVAASPRWTSDLIDLTAGRAPDDHRSEPPESPSGDIDDPLGLPNRPVRVEGQGLGGPELVGRLEEAIESGRPLDLGSGGSAGLVSADQVSEVCLALSSPVSRRSLRLSNARIAGTLDLSLVEIPGLVLLDCVVERLVLDGAELGRLELIGCDLGRVSLLAADVRRWVRLSDCSISDGIGLDQARIGADLHLDGCIVAGDDAGVAFGARRSQVGGHVVLGGGCRLDGSVDLEGVEIRGGLDGHGMVATGHPGRPAVSLAGAQVGGPVVLSSLTAGGGGVDLTGVTAARLDLADARVSAGLDGVGVGIAGSDVSGQVRLTRLRVAGAVILDGTRVRSNVDAADIEAAGIDGDPLVSGRRLEVQGVLVCDGALLRGGGVDLAGSRLGGMTARGARLQGRGARLVLDQAVVAGSVDVSADGPGGSADMEGGLGCRGIDVTGDLDLAGLRVRSLEGGEVPLDGRRATVGGAVRLDSARVEGGPVDFSDARVGRLSMNVADIGGLGRSSTASVQFDRLTCDGDLELGALTAVGSVSAVGLRVGGGVHLLGCRPAAAAPRTWGVILDDAVVGSHLRLGVNGDTGIRLHHARVRGAVSFGSASVGRGGGDAGSSVSAVGLSAERLVADGRFEGEFTLVDSQVTDAFDVSDAAFVGGLTVAEVGVGRLVGRPRVARDPKVDRANQGGRALRPRDFTPQRPRRRATAPPAAMRRALGRTDVERWIRWALAVVVTVAGLVSVVGAGAWLLGAPDPAAVAVDALVPLHSNGAVEAWAPDSFAALVVGGSRILGWWAALCLLISPAIVILRRRP